MMTTLTFTEQGIAALKKEKDDHPFPKVRRRCEVVYLQSQGFKHQDIDRIVGLSHASITNHLKLDQQGGLEALKPLNYRGQPSQLHQYTERINASLDTQPVGTSAEARASIKDLTGIAVSLPQIKYFLDHIGCKRRKVKHIPDKLDIEKHETVKREERAPFIEKAQQKEIHLLFGDAAHVVLRPF